VDDRRRIGAEGEARAAAYLARRGYRIVERNVRSGGVEIDLIAQRGPHIVFVEVKTRRTTRYGSPEAAVDARKQARLVQGAYAWIHTHPSRHRRVRFDVVACNVVGSGRSERWQLTHLPRAFDAEGSGA
jgi:putative endonuclease